MRREEFMFYFIFYKVPATLASIPKLRVNIIVVAVILNTMSLSPLCNPAMASPTRATLSKDLFEKEEYLNIFNAAYPEYDDITLNDLDSKIPNIIQQINQIIGMDRFNHYRPAYNLLQMSVDKSFFSKDTLDRFENIFNTLQLSGLGK